MKRNLLTIIFMMLYLSSFAQTNFRSITLEEAARFSKSENKLIFIDFYTDWCGPCKKMAREVFPLERVGEYFNQNFICLKLNAEKEGKDAAARFNVRAYPTFIVLNSSMEVLLDIKGAMPADDFIQKIKTGLNPHMSLERLKERYDNGERTPDVVNNYAFVTMSEKGEKAGMAIVDSYFESLSDKERRKPENFFIFKRYTVRADDSKAEYLLDNFNRFNREIRDEASELARRLYHSELLKYLSGHMFVTKMYVPQEYRILKENIISAGFDKTYPYAPVFKLIEIYADGDYSAFLDTLQEKGAEMSEGDYTVVLLNLNRLIPVNSDPELAKRVSAYVRSILPGLRASQITLMGKLLQSIEE